MRTPVNELKPGPIDQLFLVAVADHPQTKTQKIYIRMTLSDKTGSVTGIDWEPSPSRLGLKAGDVIRVVGTYSVDAQYGPQIKIKATSKAKAPNEYDESDFAQGFPNDIKTVASQFTALQEILPEEYGRFINEVLAPTGRFKDWWTAPAATTLHQGYREGLFEHSVQVAHMVYWAAEAWCPEADSTVLIVAGLLHDLGKVVEYDGPVTRQLTTMGKLYGNTMLSCSLVSDEMVRLGLKVGEPQNQNILHCILAHHGRRERGSPVIPQTIEAALIHQADQMSAKIGAYQRIVRDTPVDAEWSQRDTVFDGAMWLLPGRREA